VAGADDEEVGGKRERRSRMTTHYRSIFIASHPRRYAVKLGQ
jgi:hypothetical protein